MNRADQLPTKRDETAEQLRRLADLVQADRWEEAAKMADVVGEGFQTCFFAWQKNRQRRLDLPRGLAGVGAKLRGRVYTEQLEACRDPDDAPKRLPPLVKGDDPLQRLDRELNMEMLRWASSHRWAR